MPTHPGWRLLDGKTTHAGPRGAAAPAGASGKTVTLYGTAGKPVEVKQGGGRVAALLKIGYTRAAPARSGGVSSTGHVGLSLPPGSPPVPAGRDPQLWANQMWLNFNAARGRYPAPNPYDWRFRGGGGTTYGGGSFFSGGHGSASGASEGGGWGGGNAGGGGVISHGPTYYANPGAGEPVAPDSGGDHYVLQFSGDPGSYGAELANFQMQLSQLGGGNPDGGGPAPPGTVPASGDPNADPNHPSGFNAGGSGGFF